MSFLGECDYYCLIAICEEGHTPNYIKMGSNMIPIVVRYPYMATSFPYVIAHFISKYFPKSVIIPDTADLCKKVDKITEEKFNIYMRISLKRALLTNKLNDKYINPYVHKILKESRKKKSLISKCITTHPHFYDEWINALNEQKPQNKYKNYIIDEENDEEELVFNRLLESLEENINENSNKNNYIMLD